MTCDCYPHGPDEPCTYGHGVGCTCDINWDCTSYDPCPQRAADELFKIFEAQGVVKIEGVCTCEGPYPGGIDHHPYCGYEPEETD
jgi:hypothetical protein